MSHPPQKVMIKVVTFCCRLAKTNILLWSPTINNRRWQTLPILSYHTNCHVVCGLNSSRQPPSYILYIRVDLIQPSNPPETWTSLCKELRSFSRHITSPPPHIKIFAQLESVFIARDSAVSLSWLEIKSQINFNKAFGLTKTKANYENARSLVRRKMCSSLIIYAESVLGFVRLPGAIPFRIQRIETPQRQIQNDGISTLYIKLFISFAVELHHRIDYIRECVSLSCIHRYIWCISVSAWSLGKKLG